ncbi:RelA/SpoT domain-containing protein [Shimia thalassica]|uniref:GTP pyrophosphokinase n=1 Tax=Shimia thalassica TaxID=1715693 RepID=UPI00273285B7|nr:RelA/SpoT domain-containing protein [Shimia thalassica]MDP2493880.1 RelA/SpoT domain-containing protein [Shimia thalassica]
MNDKEFADQLPKHLKKCSRLERAIERIVSDALEEGEIRCLPLEHRTKDQSSAINKQKTKKYDTPFSEMTDLVGCRIIVYLESDIEAVEKLVREHFIVDETQSIDKRKPSSVREVGYRSLHLICSLGKERSLLKEYQELCEMPFEVQIRTAMEHTWAAIEHKLNYKSATALPEQLQRRFMVISGTLELLDRELAAISIEADAYRKKLAENDINIQSDPLSELTIVTLTLHYLAQHASNAEIHVPKNTQRYSDLLRELSDFGIKSVSEFETLLSSFPFKDLKIDESTSIHGVVRSIMFVKDYERYFRDCFHGQYVFEEDSFDDIAEIADTAAIAEHIRDLDYQIYDVL